jgi:hypothetical protein
MCGHCRAALRCPGWPQATARAARSGLDSTRRAAWHRAGRSPLRFVVRSWESDDELGDFLLIRRGHRTQVLGRNAGPQRVGEQSSPQAMRKTGIARVCRSVHWGPGKRNSCRRAWSSKRPVGAEIVQRLGQRVSPGFLFHGPSGMRNNHSRPAGLRSRFPGLLPPLAGSGSHLPKISPLARRTCRLLGVHAPPSLWAVCPNGTKTNLGEHTCLTSTQRRSQETSARTQKR